MGWRCICLLLGAVIAAPTDMVRGRRAAADTATAETAAADIVRRVLAGTPTFDDERGAVVVPAGAQVGDLLEVSDGTARLRGRRSGARPCPRATGTRSGRRARRRGARARPAFDVEC